MNLSDSYSRVADEYARRIFDELEFKPKDREILNQFSAQVSSKGRICDLGCGPGHVSKYLRERGLDVFGVDVSSGMLDQARLLNPEIEFQHMDMSALDFKDGSLAGVVALYSVIHIPRDEVVSVLTEIRRVLAVQGTLLLSHHIGNQTLRLDEWWGKKVHLDFLFFERKEMEGYLEKAGFEVQACIEREPYGPEVEAQTRRAYYFAVAK
ncbi:MAG: class I SAM-dependent methyltransferase [Bdellovibrionota bacterium]